MPERKMGTILTEFKMEVKEIQEAAQLLDSLRKTLVKLGIEGSKQTEILHTYLTLYTEALPWTARTLEALKRKVDELDISLEAKNEILRIGRKIVEEHKTAEEKGGDVLRKYSKRVSYLNRLLLQEQKIRKFLNKLGISSTKIFARKLAPATLEASILLKKFGIIGGITGDILAALGSAILKAIPALASLGGQLTSIVGIFTLAIIEGFKFLDIVTKFARETPIMTSRLEEATEQAYTMGATFGYSAAESATALAIMSKGLFKTTEELYEATATTLKFGRAFGLTGKEAGELGLALVRRLFIPTRELPHVFKELAKSITATGMSAKEVASTINEFADALIWLPEEQRAKVIPGLVELSGQLKSAGVSADWMGKAIMIAQKRAIDPRAWGELQSSLYGIATQAGVTGVEVEKLRVQLQKGQPEAIKTLAKWVAKLDKSNVGAQVVVQKLADTLGVSIETIWRGAEAIEKGGVQPTKTLADVWKKTWETIEPIITQITTVIYHLLAEVGIPLLKVFLPLFELIGVIARAIFAALKPLFAILKVIFEVIAYPIKALVALLEPFVEYLEAAVEPAVALLELAFTPLKTIMETIIDICKRFWQAFFKPLITAAKKLASGIKVIADFVGKVVKVIFKPVEYILGIIEKISNYLTGLVEKVSDALSPIAGFFDKLIPIIEKPFEFLINIVEKTIGFLIKAAATITGILTKPFKLVTGFVKGAVSAVGKVITSPFKAIAGIFKKKEAVTPTPEVGGGESNPIGGNPGEIPRGFEFIRGLARLYAEARRRELERPRVGFEGEGERIVSAINSFKEALLSRWDTAEGRRRRPGTELPWATEGVY